ncbi:MAG: hypothetical protein JO075_00645 [Acidimicrobiia bacterium]|nr:hypothetical protein [Acidimicrobiia bacterium]
MQYVHIPVSMKDKRPELIDQFREDLGRLPGPVFVPCHKGQRAGAFAATPEGRIAGRLFTSE